MDRSPSYLGTCRNYEQNIIIIKIHKQASFLEGKSQVAETKRKTNPLMVLA